MPIDEVIIDASDDLSRTGVRRVRIRRRPRRHGCGHDAAIYQLDSRPFRSPTLAHQAAHSCCCCCGCGHDARASSKHHESQWLGRLRPIRMSLYFKSRPPLVTSISIEPQTSIDTDASPDPQNAELVESVLGAVEDPTKLRPGG
jgi:hypothetical protein